MFDKVPTKSRAFVFDNEKYQGINIQWMLTGIGFGELTFSINKETQEMTCDTEGMGPEECAKILAGLVGTVVQDIKVQEPVLVITDPAVVEHVKQLTEKVRKPQ